MRVNVSGKQFVFPRSCACCGGYPLTHLTVSGAERNRNARTRGWTWDIPYCVPCRRHIQATDRILLGLLLLVAGAFVSGVTSATVSGRWSLGLQTLIFLLVSSSAVFWALLVYVRGRRSANCRGLTRAVVYLGSNGSCHSFQIRSGFYAVEFIRANHRKLVNASPQVVSILRGTRFNDYQVPRRSMRNGH